VRLLHDLAKTHATFDDPNLVSRAGLVPVMALAQRAGLPDLVAEHVRIARSCGVNAPVKVGCLAAGMIELAEPGPDLLLTLSTFWRVIADSKLAKSHATSGDPWAKRWLKNHEAGFGPFKLADLSPGRHVVWVAHKEHPFPPKLGQITFRQVPDSSNRLAMLMTGEAQAAEYLLPTDMQRVENSNDLRLWNFQGYVIASCPMNPKYPPLGDVRVRQALSYATPYPQILENVYRGFAGPAHGPLSDHAAGFDPNLSPYSYDPGRARELLREAGHGNGFKTTLAYSTAEPLGEPIGTQLRSAFAGWRPESGVNRRAWFPAS